ncbi:GrpB family protein [Phenylobacterium sp.]|uniref:GrpB family protein n=1 Tax=Phenylobacterium sp. TaxID=1871053 RepID=UPI0028992BB1|nr:GrpB family protein [Phenylobacterium sp.]
MTYGLGLERTANRLAASHPLWGQAFEEEAVRIRAAVGPDVLAIEHYGSTSVSGLPAKPIIDLLIGVTDLSVADRHAPAMIALGYDDSGNGGVEGHRIFGKGAARTHLAHFVVYEGPEWTATLRFRDLLRADPELRAAYEQLKTRLVAEHPTDRPAYTAGKSAFILATLARP